jgi:site-specific DNA recombinase
MIAYVIYARKSNESEDRQVLSIEAQLKELTDYAAKNNLIIAQTYIEAKSAKKPGRPLFNDMVKDLRRRKATGVLCWKLDRLSRNMLDAATISELLESGIISEIRTPSQIYRNTSNDKFMTGLDWIMAKKYIDDLSENVKRGLRTKAQLGWLPGRAPLGYLNPPLQRKGQRMIIKDPQRFNLLRRMWEMLLSDQYSVPEILDAATNKWGFKRPKCGNTPERPLARATLYEIFTNPFYCGKFTYGGEWYEGKHELMVTPDEFERAQMILGRKGKSRPKKHVFAFTGLFKCGQCGAQITAEEKYKKIKSTGLTKRYVYYHCTHMKDRNCTQGSVEETALKSQIDSYLRQISLPEPYLEWIFKYLNKVKDQEQSKTILGRDNLREQLRKVNAKLENLLTLKISPENATGELLSDSEYLSQKGKMLSEKMSLDRALAQHNQVQSETRELTKATFNFASYARIWFSKGDRNRKRSILTAAYSNRTILAGKVLMEAKKPLQVIQKFASRVAGKNLIFEPLKFGLDNTQAAPFEDGFCARLRQPDDIRTEILEILSNPYKYREEKAALENIRQLNNSMSSQAA